MAGFPIVVDVMVKGLDTINRLITVVERVSDQLEETTHIMDELADEIHHAGIESRQAAKQVNRFGKATKEASKESNSFRERLEGAATSFRAMGASGTLAGDTLERFGILTSGPVGFAIAGLVAGTAAAVAGFKALEYAVSRGIATNKKYTQQVDSLKTELNKTAAILGQVLLDVVGFGNAIETSHGKVKSFNEDVVKDSTEIADAMRDVFIAVLHGVKFIGNGLLGIKVVVSGIGTAIGGMAAIVVNAFSAIPDLAAEMMLSVAKAIRTGLEDLGVPSTMLDQFFGTEAELRRRLRKATAGADQAAAAQRRIFSGMKDDLYEIGAGLEKWNDRLNNAIQGLEQARGTAATITLDRDPDAPTKPAPVNPVAAALAAARGETTAALAKATPLATGEEIIFDEFAEGANNFLVILPELTAKLDAARAQARALNEEAQSMGGTFHKVVLVLRDTMVESVEIAKDSFAAATGEVANFFGAFAAGESTLSEFGDAMADLAANIANTFGDLFIKQGIGLALFNPGVGAALIAAGFALKMLGGAVASKGSANRGTGASTGSGASGAAASQAVAREVTRSLRPSGADGENVTNIEVVIGGRSIQPEMVAIVDDIARQRRSRYLGRRMGAF